MISYYPDSEWRGTVIEIADDNRSGKVTVVVKNAMRPATPGRNVYELDKLAIRCWQRPEQLNIEIGDYVKFTNIDIDGRDHKRKCEDSENGTNGEFTILKAANSSKASCLKYFIKQTKSGLQLDSIAHVEGRRLPAPPNFVEWYDADKWEFVLPEDRDELLKNSDSPVASVMLSGYLKRKS